MLTIHNILLKTFLKKIIRCYCAECVGCPSNHLGVAPTIHTISDNHTDKLCLCDECFKYSTYQYTQIKYESHIFTDMKITPSLCICIDCMLDHIFTDKLNELNNKLNTKKFTNPITFEFIKKLLTDILDEEIIYYESNSKTDIFNLSLLSYSAYTQIFDLLINEYIDIFEIKYNIDNKPEPLDECKEYINYLNDLKQIEAEKLKQKQIEAEKLKQKQKNKSIKTTYSEEFNYIFKSKPNHSVIKEYKFEHIFERIDTLYENNNRLAKDDINKILKEHKITYEGVIIDAIIDERAILSIGDINIYDIINKKPVILKIKYKSYCIKYKFQYEYRYTRGATYELVNKEIINDIFQECGSIIDKAYNVKTMIDHITLYSSDETITTTLKRIRLLLPILYIIYIVNYSDDDEKKEKLKKYIDCENKLDIETPPSSELDIKKSDIITKIELMKSEYASNNLKYEMLLNQYKMIKKDITDTMIVLALFNKPDKDTLELPKLIDITFDINDIFDMNNIAGYNGLAQFINKYRGFDPKDLQSDERTLYYKIIDIYCYDCNKYKYNCIGHDIDEYHILTKREYINMITQIKQMKKEIYELTAALKYINEHIEPGLI